MMGFIPVEGQHYHNLASKIRMYLREFKGQDLKKAQSLLRSVINEFEEEVGVKICVDKENGITTTEYPDGTFEVSVDLTKKEKTKL